jgi:hypothetical protein
MNGKKIAAIMVAGLIAAALVAAPAEAGVGGCFRNQACGGFQSVQTPVVKSADDGSPALDALRWLLPNDVYASLKTYLQHGDTGKGVGQVRTEGVGGCFFICVR